MSGMDPIESDPDLYRVVFENARVRVLEYRDTPGDHTHPHRHPDSVMCTLSSFARSVSADGRHVDLTLDAGEVRWLGAQEHTGHNTGTTPTHAIFVELKESDPAGPSTAEVPLGPVR